MALYNNNPDNYAVQQRLRFTHSGVITHGEQSRQYCGAFIELQTKSADPCVFLLYFIYLYKPVVGPCFSQMVITLTMTR